MRRTALEKSSPERLCAAVLAAGLIAVTACEPVEKGVKAGAMSSAALTTACVWDPGFSLKDCSQSNWWLEFAVDDLNVQTLEVEISDSPGRIVSLPNRFGSSGRLKFTGGLDSPVENDTLVRLKATQSVAAGGRTAMSAWFGYRQTPPLTCADGVGPVDAGGAFVDAGSAVVDAGISYAPEVDAGLPPGHCKSPWSPSWAQTNSAGSWWVEFQVTGGGSLPKLVSLEVVARGETTPLTYDVGRWAGGITNVAAGTQVILHATDVTGATAKSVPFPYLVDTQPLTDPCGGTPSTMPGCLPLAGGLLTLTMDDSLESQATLALPVMAKYGVKATIFHITNNLQNFGQLPSALALAAAGHEVGSHSQSHPDLTTSSAQSLDDELRLSKAYLVANVGQPVESFASPMGDYNATTLAAIRRNYTSHRTVNPGLNYVGNSLYELNADGAYNDVTPSQMCALLAETAAKKGWRILVFHEFTTALTSASSLTYPISNLDAALACAKATPGLSVVTMREGVAAIACGAPP